IVVNLQGDLPAIDPALIRASLVPLRDPAVDIATLVVPTADPGERDNPNVVKAVMSLAARAAVGPMVGRALYFTRAAAPSGAGPVWHHIGIYAWRRPALDRFVGLPPSPLEKREKLEQLRALEAGMRIDAAVADGVPFGVDTPEDLARARAMLEQDA
ncbi:MAG: 3-deoxy-manno-octulosonate cytidylyltransferase, partial [Rhodospirillaceae bacterium]|nr:3-deoxy-manno-octulosonate cytidylyltransferase [Rhodospirillaceae bacterium]